MHWIFLVSRIEEDNYRVNYRGVSHFVVARYSCRLMVISAHIQI